MWLIALSILAVAGLFGALVLYFAYVEEGVGSRRRNALPTAYSPELYVADPEKVPGRCPECFTDNDPSFDYCENCATELPDVEEPTGASSLRERFGVR